MRLILLEMKRYYKPQNLRTMLLELSLSSNIYFDLILVFKYLTSTSASVASHTNKERDLWNSFPNKQGHCVCAMLVRASRVESLDLCIQTSLSLR